MEEKKTQKTYKWGWTLYKAMLYAMGFYGASRIIFTLTAIVIEDEYTVSITWSILLMGVLFIMSAVLGLRGIKRNRNNSKMVLILSIVSAIMAVFTTFKLVGFFGKSDLAEGGLILFIVWIIFGLFPPILLLGSIMQFSNKKSEVNLEEEKSDKNSELIPEEEKTEK